MTRPPAETWHAALDRLQRSGVPHVLATQVTSAGSTPREPGARMVITQEAIYDTLGGGTFEWQTIHAARDFLQQGRAGFHLEAFSLGGRSGQCCGGYVNVLLEMFPGAAISIALFGAGHVGREIVSLSEPLPWQIHWFDSRTDVFNEHDQQQSRLSCHKLSSAQEATSALPPRCHALVLTHNHDEDYALITALLQRQDIASIGLIGSDSKWASFRGRLQREGYTTEQIERVRSPIGCIHNTKLSNKTPYAIALTVVTELLWLTDKPASLDMRGLEPNAIRALVDDTKTTQS
ncbi:MAG: xanthine dehydrogenase accessory protein XdhC [Gammaproteobacteria bacterium]|uniref:Xanthine dehydrogenase accessory protein XdhC n=1 Tax=Vreelandella venusta TaxID=44935 RepID=A0ABX2BAB7_9GAMM|nr:xanthine dehydrogenase accessory protein XdhC [Halomonas venusta]MBR9923771.1 xanthine dehydrogenase accessory protein XdhC [Gammaproteobacteria bacterium]AZM95772.1 xanthine dehydrogenase accessory protein XdhC [Halomonas venusta]MDW0361137.1 xanthine dehydrogenase accessory protein XdhC [Halomonas venusta]MDX1714151.1 xanthine dehydrogenase accessory protein XdhC [Halomonas venusta]NPT30952.1 xanthine dehydrogenase accessory protein XdhC [Halomonas venusta]